MLNTDKELKLYYSISEVARMFDVNESLRNFEIVERLKSIREELIGMKESLDAFTYEDVEALKENLMKEQPG